MLKKFKTLSKKQKGFSILGLLTIVLSIGLIFIISIAIPYSSDVHKSNNDLKVEHGVQHVAIKIETWITNERGTGTLTEANLATALEGITLEPGVSVAVTGDKYRYCIIGVHEDGKKYVKPTGTSSKPTIENAFNYNSQTGGMNKTCGTSYTLPEKWSNVATD